MVKKTGLKLHASLCFHGSKQPNIPLPDWVTRIGETEPGIYFTDRSGSQYKECLSLGVDDVPVLERKTPMEVYSAFLESFKLAFSDYLGNTITGITIGLGPDGELRYPSYQTRKLSNVQESFNAMIGICLPLSDTMLKLMETHFGDSAVRTMLLLMINSLIPLHSSRMVDHGNRNMVISSFLGTHLFSSHTQTELFLLHLLHLRATLCGKLPLLHQWHKLRSRPSELTAGFYCNDDHDRYEAFAETFAKNSCRMILPGTDLSDEHQSPESLSSPESLLAHIKTCCKKYGVIVSGQNSTEPILGGFKRIVENLKDQSAEIDLFTYQRIGALFFSPDHFHAFTEFVRNLSQFKLPEDDLPAEEEEENAGGKTLTTSMQAA